VTDSTPKLARRRRSPSRSDPSILAELLALHAAPGPVLDASWGSGGIWPRRLLDHYRPLRLDARPETQPDVVGDWNRLGELFPSSAFATALWDPPYLSDAGAGLVGAASWGARYGTRGPGLRGKSVCHLFEPFLASVRQVLDPARDTLIVKLGDQVHQGQLQWQPFELRRVALELGWLACDYQVRVRAQPLDPKWKAQRHARRGATFWLAFHTGPRCPNPGLDLVRVCAGATDGHLFRPRRRDQLTYSDRCRQRRHRSGRDLNSIGKA
jgi:hypothetical protein